MRPSFGRRGARKLRVLDFDIENRPLAYMGHDRTSAEITAIAWSWEDEQEVHVRTLMAPPYGERSAKEMLALFHDFYREADVVTGHYIRGHDLPIINSALVEFGMPPLGPKLTSDTFFDLITYGGQSRSQMALANVLGVEAEKPRMTVNRWRDANRLTPEGIDATIERVTGDVRQHKELRAALVKRGLLKTPRTWTP